MGAALKALASIPGNSLFVADNAGPEKQAPFDDALFAWIGENRFRHNGNPDSAELIRRLESFNPDVLYVASWNSPAYRGACVQFRGRAVRVSAMDNQWRGTFKQRLGILTAPVHIRRLFDCIFVAGERQRNFAERLGFDSDSIWQGFCCPDFDAYHAVRLPETSPRPDSFLFAGRLVEDKGIRILADAYKQYRESCSSPPWPLNIAGHGSLEYLLREVPGIAVHGFVQPDKLPELFRTSGAFVLPSLFEPWGVVIQEAATAGMPLICSSECGATVHYLMDGYNGYVVETGNVKSLRQALQRMASAPPEELARMANASLALSEQITPRRWAAYFVEKSSQARLSSNN
jgi:glycosyltransferase involved in cell wall biosynthesis